MIVLRDWKILRLVLAGAGALAAVVVVTSWIAWGRGDGAVADPMPDFATLLPRDQPNDYLALPPGFAGTATPHAESPVFGVALPVLEAAALTAIRAQPRIDEVATDAARHQYAFVQRTALLRFPDTVTVRFVDAGADRSSLAIYSRSKLGYSDLGANRRRIEAWFAAIRAVVPATGG